MTALSPENQATLDRIGVAGLSAGRLPSFSFSSSQLEKLMTAVRNEALAPHTLKVPRFVDMPYLAKADEKAAEALCDFESEPGHVEPSLILAVGILLGTQNQHAAVAVFIALMNLFPETDFG